MSRARLDSTRDGRDTFTSLISLPETESRATEPEGSADPGSFSRGQSGIGQLSRLRCHNENVTEATIIRAIVAALGSGTADGTEPEVVVEEGIGSCAWD